MVAYTRDHEGYSSKWYDKTETDGTPTPSDLGTTFTFDTPANKDGDIYISIESFVARSVYSTCTTGQYNYQSGGGTVTGSAQEWVVDATVRKGN